MRVTSEATLWRRWLASAEMTEREARIVVRCRLRDWKVPSVLGAAGWVLEGPGTLADSVVVEGLVARFNIETLKAKVRP